MHFSHRWMWFQNLHVSKVSLVTAVCCMLFCINTCWKELRQHDSPHNIRVNGSVRNPFFFSFLPLGFFTIDFDHIQPFFNSFLIQSPSSQTQICVLSLNFKPIKSHFCCPHTTHSWIWPLPLEWPDLGSHTPRKLIPFF